MAKKKKKSTAGHQSYSSGIQHTINGNIPYIPSVAGTYKCNVCKKKKTYFAITYEGYNQNTTRRICKPCYTKKMDKFFGIKGGKVEKLLYENEEDSTK